MPVCVNLQKLSQFCIQMDNDICFALSSMPCDLHLKHLQHIYGNLISTITREYSISLNAPLKSSWQIKRIFLRTVKNKYSFDNQLLTRCHQTRDLLRNLQLGFLLQTFPVFVDVCSRFDGPDSHSVVIGGCKDGGRVGSYGVDGTAVGLDFSQLVTVLDVPQLEEAPSTTTEQYVV